MQRIESEELEKVVSFLESLIELIGQNIAFLCRLNWYFLVLASVSVTRNNSKRRIDQKSAFKMRARAIRANHSARSRRNRDKCHLYNLLLFAMRTTNFGTGWSLYVRERVQRASLRSAWREMPMSANVECSFKSLEYSNCVFDES